MKSSSSPSKKYIKWLRTIKTISIYMLHKETPVSDNRNSWPGSEGMEKGM